MRKLVLLLIFFGAQAYQPYNLYFVDSDDAKCLDGTSPSFYFIPGSESGVNKFLIYFQGGGLIGGNTLQDTIVSAYQRSFTPLGSSASLEQQKSWETGILARNEILNPNFYNWNSIHINYCDGTGHQGYKADPININGRDLYIRGEANTKAVIKTLNEKFNFLLATDVLVTGCSAGGLATYIWAEYFRSIFDLRVKVKVAPDSGLFLDMDPINGDLNLAIRKIYFQNIVQIANVERDPINNKCVAANPNEKWKCLMSPYLVEYIDVPLFFVQSLYDAWSIPNILYADCIKNKTLESCTAEQLRYIEIHHQQAYNIMKKTIAKGQNAGGWSPACINHCYLEWEAFNSPQYNVPEKSGATISSTLGSWFNEGTSQNHSHIDEVSWPLNARCSQKQSMIRQ